MVTKGKRPDRSVDYEAQWDEPSEEEELELPSGKKVVVRPPNIARLAKRGLIPNHMLGAVEKFILGGMRTLVQEVPNIRDIAAGDKPGTALIRTADLEDYMDAVCVASIVAPKFVFEGEKGGIPIARLSGADKYAVWDWGVGLTQALATFRGHAARPVEPVGPLPDGEGVRDEAEPAAASDAA